MRFGPKSGVSLLELVIAIAVIGLLAALTVPVISSFRNSARQKTCLRNYVKVQEAMRAYASFRSLKVGDHLMYDWFLGNSPSHLAANPWGCDYPTRHYTFGGNVPPVGTPYILSCSPSIPGYSHTPTQTTGW